MATPSEGKNASKCAGGSSANSAADEESHVLAFTPTMMANYKRALQIVLIAPWEGICKHRTCDCKPPLPLRLSTSWDRPNRGRRVLKCANSADHGCGYECFICRGISGPDPNTIDFLYDRVKRLVAANVVMRSKLAALESAANDLWVRDDPLESLTQPNIVDDKGIFTDDEVLEELYHPNSIKKHNPPFGL